MIKSFFVAGLSLLVLIIFYPWDHTLMIMGFLITQLTMGCICLSLFLLRITTLLKNKGTGIYYFLGTLQTILFAIDLLLILFNHDLLKNSLMIFAGLNGGMATIIFFDIYKPRYAKGNIAGASGTPSAHHQNYGAGK